MENLAEIVRIITDIFVKDYMNRIVIDASRSYGLGLTREKVGGAIQISLLKKLVDVMSNPVDSFTVGKKNYKRDQEYLKHQRIFNVYHTGEGKETRVYILHSPTDPMNITDLIADAGLALNFRTKRVNKPVKLQLEAEKKWLKVTDNIATVAYSLGSAIAEISSKEGSQSREIVVISRPITFLNVRDLLPKNVFSLKSKLDPVGILSLLIPSGSKEKRVSGKKITSPADWIKEHSAKLVLKRLEDEGIMDVGVPEKEGGYALTTAASRKRLKEKMEKEKMEKEMEKVPEKTGKGKKSVKELKAEVRKLRKEKKASVKSYPLDRARKGDLLKMISDLEAL
jgi:hypothetical protein